MSEKVLRSLIDKLKTHETQIRWLRQSLEADLRDLLATQLMLEANG